jgi:4-hydroxy-4-methyl-2-oxoglutarate aldolase
VTDELRGRLATLDSSSLSDALDKLRIPGQALGIMPIVRHFKVAGPAYTVRMLPRGMSGTSVGDYIDDVPVGRVIVIDNAARTDTTVWGDILTEVAHRRGVAGTVIDGVCRDTDVSVEIDYPVFARSHTMRTGKDRVAAEAYEQPVALGGIRVEPGDWIFGDADGVLVLPQAYAASVIAEAERIVEVEKSIRAAVRSGTRLADARDALNYHRLQTPDPS